MVWNNVTELPWFWTPFYSPLFGVLAGILLPACVAALLGWVVFKGRVTGVFHCFTETLDVAKAALDLGFHVSFSGIITFRNAGELREVVRYVPLDRCLIETDSPYLAPVPHRGKTNSPAYVPFVARQVAELKGLGVEAIASATSTNFERLFGVGDPGDRPPEEANPG